MLALKEVDGQGEGIGKYSRKRENCFVSDEKKGLHVHVMPDDQK